MGYHCLYIIATRVRDPVLGEIGLNARRLGDFLVSCGDLEVPEAKFLYICLRSIGGRVNTK